MLHSSPDGASDRCRVLNCADAGPHVKSRNNQHAVETGESLAQLAAASERSFVSRLQDRLHFHQNEMVCRWVGTNDHMTLTKQTAVEQF
jgi:hypothetical protein